MLRLDVPGLDILGLDILGLDILGLDLGIGQTRPWCWWGARRSRHRDCVRAVLHHEHRLHRLGHLAWSLAARGGTKISTTIIDRNGKLLRAYAMADGRWRLPVDAKRDVDPAYLKLLLAYEDQRFYSHPGVDPLALTRAVFQLMARGHIVSGGSTITMQLARLMEPRRERSLHAELRQIVRALQIERQLDKDQILNLY